MNWRFLKATPFLDTRAKFVAEIPLHGKLLDIGSSDGQTLNHMFELRPDLEFYSTDIAGSPECYPAACHFHRSDIRSASLPWKDSSMDAITAFQLVEHLDRPDNLIKESWRLLAKGGRVMFEFPHPKTVGLRSPHGRLAGTFTLNFYDDVTHVRPLSAGGLANQLRNVGFRIERSGISRNWILAIAYLVMAFFPSCRPKFIAYVHFIGWSAFVVATKD